MRRCMHRVLGFMKHALESVYLPLFADLELHTSQHASWNPEIDARIAACFNVCEALYGLNALNAFVRMFGFRGDDLGNVDSDERVRKINEVRVICRRDERIVGLFVGNLRFRRRSFHFLEWLKILNRILWRRICLNKIVWINRVNSKLLVKSIQIHIHVYGSFLAYRAF